MFITDGHAGGNRQQHASDELTAKGASLQRVVLGAAGRRAQRAAPRRTVDGRFALSRATTATVKDLSVPALKARDARKTSSQLIKFHGFDYERTYVWNVPFCDAGGELRPHGS